MNWPDFFMVGGAILGTRLYMYLAGYRRPEKLVRPFQWNCTQCPISLRCEDPTKMLEIADLHTKAKHG